MKAFLLAVVMTVAISIVAWYGLTQAGFSAEEVYSKPGSVRLDTAE
ncbi:MAG: hypothetical protein AAFR52_01455 [Pseudomonadota bacterium]